MDAHMHRILTIGNAGAGKTTFAKQLARKLDLPLIHLDRIYWHGDWEHLSRDKFDVILLRELEKPRWIIDGNFNRTIPRRLSYCDTVFFFDFPTLTCLSGVTKRILTNYGSVRDDIGGNCAERFDAQKLSLYRNVITFNKQHRKEYYRLLSHAVNVNVIVFKNRRQVNAYLQSLDSM